MEFKLSSGRKIKIKDVSVDEQDEMLDSVKYIYNKKGEPKGGEMMHSTITKWIRLGVEGDTSDKFIKSLTFEERTEIFLKMQEELLVGEGKASS